MKRDDIGLPRRSLHSRYKTIFLCKARADQRNSSTHLNDRKVQSTDQHFKSINFLQTSSFKKKMTFMPPLDNSNSTKRNNNLLLPTRMECITTQSSFSRMSPTSSYGNTMPSPTSVLQHHQQHHQQQQQQQSTNYGMQFMPPLPPFFVQACYPTTTPNEFPAYFRPTHQAASATFPAAMTPPPLMQISHAQQPQHQTYKMSNARQQQQQQQQQMNNTNHHNTNHHNTNHHNTNHHHQNNTIIPSPPSRRYYSQHTQCGRNQQQRNPKQRQQHQSFSSGRISSQATSPTFSNSSDESEPVLLTRSHTVPDATSDSSYTLATLFRNKIFVGSLTQSVSEIFYQINRVLKSFLNFSLNTS